MKKTALLIIDVQNGMFTDEDPVLNGESLLQNIKYIISKARINNIPIYYIQHNSPAGTPLEFGTYGWEIHPEIATLENDVIIQKKTPDSFFQTELEDRLKEHNIGHLLVTGIQSEVCVDTTCRRAFGMGYDVTLVADAHSTWNSEELTGQQIINHHNQVLRWFADVKDSNLIELEQHKI